MRFSETAEGWLEAAPSEAGIAWAAEQVRVFDQTQPADKRQAPGERWHGPLAERGFDGWLEDEGVEREWNGGVDALADFVVAGAEVSLKARTFRATPRAHYVVNVVDKHRAGIEAEVFFAAFDRSREMVMLLGGIRAEEFFEAAEFVPVGGWLNPSTRATLATWNLPIDRLESPVAWLGRVAGRLGRDCADCGRPALADDYPYERCLRCGACAGRWRSDGWTPALHR